MSRKQLDLFGTEPEPDLLDEDWTPPVMRADPEKVRATACNPCRGAGSIFAPVGQADRQLLPDRFPADGELAARRRGSTALGFDFEVEMERLKAA